MLPLFLPSLWHCSAAVGRLQAASRRLSMELESERAQQQKTQATLKESE